MKQRAKNIWNVFKNLPRRGKAGVFLWLVGYPITFLGGLLIAVGHHIMGTVLLLTPLVEGNIGIILAGTEVVKAIKNELFGKE